MPVRGAPHDVASDVGRVEAVSTGIAPEAGALFRRYLLWIGASVFVFMAANGIAQSVFVWRDTEAALQERHRRSVDAAAGRIAGALDDVVDDLRLTLKLMEGYARIDPGLRQQELHRLLKAQRLVTAARLDYADGTTLAAAARLTTDAAMEGVDDARFGPALPIAVPPRVGEPSYGRVFLDRGSEPRVRLALSGRPPQSSSTDLVLTAELSLNFLSGLLRELGMAGNASLYAVDPQRRVIAHSEPGRSLAALDWSQLHPQAPLPPAQATVVRLIDAEAGDALVTTASVAALDALLVFEEPHSAAWQPVRDSVVRSAFATVVALLLAALAALLLVRRMRQPLAQLARANERIRSQAERMTALNAELEVRNAQLDLRSGEAERANSAKTRFLAAASHDLRQPLHTVALLSDLLGRRLHHGDDAVLAQQLQQAVSAMDRLFQGILDISKLDAGIVAVHRQSFALAPLLERVRSQAEPLAQARGIDLRVRTSGTAIDSDPVLLERILLNLVGNAIRYTPAGRVLVGCRRRGDQLRIEVWDTGIGIAAAQQQRVFEEFVQLDNAARDREQGLGLGLSVVRRLGDLLGHRIGLVSAPGRGSCFSVEAPAAAELPRAPETGPAVAPAHAAALAGSFFVLIDDDAMVLRAMSALFTDWSCHCVAAADAEDAIDQLQRHLRTPDAIVCDHRLHGGVTGPAAVAAVRSALDEAVPALIITGDVAASDLQGVHAAGLPLLHKPVSAERLAQALAALVRASADSTDSPL